MVHRNDNKLR